MATPRAKSTVGAQGVSAASAAPGAARSPFWKKALVFGATTAVLAGVGAGAWIACGPEKPTEKQNPPAIVQVEKQDISAWLAEPCKYALELAREYAKSGDDQVRRDMIIVALNTGYRNATPEETTKVVAALRATKDGSPETVYTFFDAGTPEKITPTRLEAVKAIGDLGHGSYREFLAKLLYDKNPEVKVEAAKSLAKLRLNTEERLFVAGELAIKVDNELDAGLRKFFKQVLCQFVAECKVNEVNGDHTGIDRTQRE